MNLTYTGPVKELGFKLPLSTIGERIVVRPGQPFEVDEANGAALLAKYGGKVELLEEVTAPRRMSKSAAKPEEPKSDAADTE